MAEVTVVAGTEIHQEVNPRGGNPSLSNSLRFHTYVKTWNRSPVILDCGDVVLKERP